MKKSLFFLYGVGNGQVKYGGGDFPESVLGMPVKKILFPGFYRRERTKYQNLRIAVIKRREKDDISYVFLSWVIFTIAENLWDVKGRRRLRKDCEKIIKIFKNS